MKIKVCGMRDAKNIESLIALEPNFMGFIFYAKSKRFISNFPKVTIPSTIKKVGVFVNETINEVVVKTEEFQLDCVQLHGNESPQYCNELRNSFLNHSKKSNLTASLEIFKAFSVDENFDFSITNAYEATCNYFLFDTKGKDYGGNGTKFNWQILQQYKGNTPFLLSGGISKNDVEAIKQIKHKLFAGVDINSGFEIEPALKNINDIKEFKFNLL